MGCPVMEGIEEMGRAVEALPCFGGYAEKILLILSSSLSIGYLEFSLLSNLHPSCCS